ncbi:MAG: methyl-accepting chemotaxis protein [Candidatus Cohnella colombiensis]|uniref:Methyl-accepting chemotaxis protein n=1 Tax=Candidatus Cohnella colombiensis TaxID=3121368 RepID=A0AA95JEZ4_9BACL|nr:MAG: methyl-accepting chemotaxis protein [Cohnella sp.]
MKKSLKDRIESIDWKKGTQSVSGLSKRVGGQIKGAKFENPIRSVGMKLFLLIFCSIIVCVLSLGWFSYSKSSSIIQQKVADASVQTAVATTGKLGLLMEGYERQSLQFITDGDFMSLLATLGIVSDDYEKFNAARQLTEKMASVVSANNTIESISLIPLDEKNHFITTGSSIKQEEVRKLAYLQNVQDAGGKVVWIPTLPRGLDGTRISPTLGIGRYLAQNKYFIIIEIKLKAIEDQMSTVSFGDDSNSYIVSNENTIVYAADMNQIGQNYAYDLPEDVGSKEIKADGANMLTSMGIIKNNNWKLVGTIPVSALVKDAKVISNLTWLMTFFAAIIAAIIGVIVMLTVGRPLSQLRTLMNEGEKGNLTVRSSIRKKDEIGQLSDSFNRMMEEITGLVRQTNQSAQEVLETAAALTDASRKTAGAAKEIAVATEEIANGATNLAVESEKGSEMTLEIGSQVQHVIESNEQMGQSAHEVELASRKGTDYMGVLIEKTGQTEDMTRNMVEKVDKLKDSTGSIRKILDVLGKISKQTNILSLNATIEAARAGTAGKGFMVVADEIRTLADQSRQSITVVGEIVEKIQLEIDETVSVLSEAYPIFQEQIESVREANQIFYVVQDNMSGFIDRLDQATNSVRQLEGTQGTLSLAMSNVSAVAEESSATSEEVASLSNEQMNISDGLVQLSVRLEAVSTQLRESLSRFTVS